MTTLPALRALKLAGVNLLQPARPIIQAEGTVR